ncbi:unnamed protein product [Thlaspi arvense]|uniref:WEB family protein n=1 Tax=Thlaspi arvense TaxID=13288 RepID=A0AAU9S5X4_THLAR|nr:unnamed protein product [Thlaspi arvense]
MAESPESGTVIDPKCLNPDTDLSYNANCRAEIDTSPPIESVREAANRFGGFGFWRPSYSTKVSEAFQENVMELKAQAAELKKDLIVKERETLHVLKELEATKATVEELSSKLQQNNEEEMLREDVPLRGRHIKPAGVVLKDLSQAKMNLCKTTVDLAGIRGMVEHLNNQLNEEKAALEKTRERLMQKSLKVISLEEEATVRSFVKNGEKDAESKALVMMNEVQRLSREAQEFKKTGEDARTEAVKAMAEIEHTRDKIKTAKIRLVAARNMKEAARAAEAVAIAEIKAVTGSKNATVTISAEEYAALARKGRDAEEDARKRVEDAMLRVEEANVSKKDVLKKVDEASREIETSKRALEEAVERVDAANATKLEVEEALRKCSSENGQRRRSSSSVNNTSRFKNRRETTTATTTRLMDVNGLSLTYDVVVVPSSPVPVLKPTMSIGQILSKKLLLAEDSEMNVASERRKMSLGQMLAKNSDGERTVSKSAGKENGKRSATRKRKNFGFAKISVLLNKESKDKKKKKMKKKEIALNLR